MPAKMHCTGENLAKTSMSVRANLAMVKWAHVLSEQDGGSAALATSISHDWARLRVHGLILK